MKHTLKYSFVAAGLALLATTSPADSTKVGIGGGPYLDIPQLSRLCLVGNLILPSWPNFLLSSVRCANKISR